MSDEPEYDDFSESDDDFGEEETGLFEGERAINATQNTLDAFMDAATVDAVYGEPIENGDTLIIPSAEILAVMGFGIGIGSGYGSDGDEPSKNLGGGSGGGGGGGGRVLARPVAVIISSPEGVRVEPVVDITKIALAGLTAFGFMVAMAGTFKNPKRAFKAMRGE